MGKLNLLSLLLLAFRGCQTVAERQVIEQGGVYTQTCGPQSTQPLYITQFFRDKVKVKMFNTVSTVEGFFIISNDTTVDEELMNVTDRYSVELHNQQYRLVIKDLKDSDSGWYGCRLFNTEKNSTFVEQSSTELFVPGPLIGLRWTADTSKLRKEADQIPDGGICLTTPKNPKMGCLVDVSNVEPMVNITIGRYGQPGATDIIKQFRQWGDHSTDDYSGGVRFRSTITFERNFGFQQKNIRNIYCRASINGTTLEKSVNIQVISKPDDRPCNPKDFHARVGNKNVNLTCLVEAHPAVDVIWTTPDGANVTEQSSNSQYTVTNSERFEGLFTTLTIAKVDKPMYGDFMIKANNSEGTGIKSLTFKEGAAGITRSSVSLIISMMSILVWLLK